MTPDKIHNLYYAATNQTLRLQDERLAFAFAYAIEAHTREECAKVVEQEIRYGTAYEYVNHNLAIKLIADKIRSLK